MRKYVTYVLIGIAVLAVAYAFLVMNWNALLPAGAKKEEVKPPTQVEKPKEEKPKEEKPKEERPKEEAVFKITKLESFSFPGKGVVTPSGIVTVNIEVENASTVAGTRKLELKLDGKVIDSMEVTLNPGVKSTLKFSVKNIGKPGAHKLELGDQAITINVIGEIPPEPKVMGPNEGLTEIGIPGGKIVVSTIAGPKTFNHHVAQETSSTAITGLMHAGLVETNVLTAADEPALATSWEISEDKTQIIFHLRKGVKFSDGVPFTADDVLFTFNDVVFNEDVNTDYRDVLKVKGQPIKVEKIDDYTVKVLLPEPFRPIINAIGGAIMPKHRLAQYVAKLNPGASGSLRDAKELYDGQKEAIQGKGIAAERLAAIEQAFADLEKAINAKDAAQVKTVATKLLEGLEAIKIALPAEEEDLKKALDQMKDSLNKAMELAAAGKFAGVPRGAFNDAWSISAKPEEFAGLGPFVFKEYITAQQVVLERNPYYWKVDANGVQLPYVDQIVFIVVESIDAQFAKFKTGETDTYGPRPEDWPLMLGSEPKCREGATGAFQKVICMNEGQGWKLLKDGPTFGENFITFNQDAPNPLLRAVFRNLQFRKAIAYATDKKSIIDNIYNGLAIPQWSPVSIPSPFYDEKETFTKYEFDLNKSKELLDQIGLIDTDGDGTRNITDRFLQAAGIDPATLPENQRNENDRELEFVLTTNKGNTIREDIANLFVNDFSKIGIKANFRPMDFNALVTDLLGSQYEAVIIGLTGGVEPNNGANVWKTDGGLHFWRFSSKTEPPEWEKRVDELFDAGVSTFDFEEAKKIYVEFQKLVSENLPWVYTVNGLYLYASKKDLGNNENFNPIGSVLAFSDMVWWKTEERRVETAK